MPGWEAPAFVGTTTSSSTSIGLPSPCGPRSWPDCWCRCSSRGSSATRRKGPYFGTIRLWALMVALLAQSAFGLLSDRSRLRWGRRRPFIFSGTLLEVLILLSLGWIAGLQGMTGYTFILIAYILSMFFSNMSQAGTQGLIPDLVPESKRGISSGLKMLLEIPLPLAVAGLVIAPMVSAGNINGAVLVTCAVMAVCMGLTMLARERRPDSDPGPLNWRPFASLVLMTAVFVLVVLGLGEVVKWLVRALGDASRYDLWPLRRARHVPRGRRGHLCEPDRAPGPVSAPEPALCLVDHLATRRARCHQQHRRVLVVFYPGEALHAGRRRGRACRVAADDSGRLCDPVRAGSWLAFGSLRPAPSDGAGQRWSARLAWG